MLGLSWGEIFIIGVLALVVLGPDELPRVAKTIVNLLNSFRRQSDDVRREFYNAVYKPAEDLRHEITKTLVAEQSEPTEKPSNEGKADEQTPE